jgi:transposase
MIGHHTSVALGWSEPGLCREDRRLRNEPITVSLEALVPAGHFYRHLEAKLDPSFSRDWAQELYAPRGRPSIDPAVFFKLQLIMVFERICSNRKLIETASLNLAHRWYLGYALDEDLPGDLSVTHLTNTPARWAADPLMPSAS